MNFPVSFQPQLLFADLSETAVFNCAEALGTANRMGPGPSLKKLSAILVSTESYFRTSVASEDA